MIAYIGGAECLGLANNVGTIKPGMTADFVAVDRDPLADINALQEIMLVVHDFGEPLKPSIYGLLIENQ